MLASGDNIEDCKGRRIGESFLLDVKIVTSLFGNKFRRGKNTVGNR